MPAIKMLASRPEFTVLPAHILPGGDIERSYPGAADIAGWTVFLRTDKAYIYQDFAPLFQTEREAKKFLRERYAARINISRNDSEPRHTT